MPSVETIERLLQQGEGLNIEFKQARTKLPNDLFESVCAFLNRQGGHLVLGVKDDGTAVGVDEATADALQRDFATLSNNPNKLQPPFLLELQPVRVAGHLLLYVYVPQSSQVHRSGSVVFDRGHEGDFRVLSDEAIGQLYTRKSNYFTEGQIYPYLRLTDFQPGLLDRARNLMRSNRPDQPWLALGDEELLRSAGLYKTDFQTGVQGYTLAAALLFGREEVIQSIVPHYRIDAVVRRHDLDRYDDRLDIRSNLMEAYEQLTAFVTRHLPDPFHLEGAQRVSLREKIFREVIANLLVHREYTNAAPARLIIYADRVELDNANRPLRHGPINPESFAPHPKNPALSKFFVQLGRMEELGSGVRNVTRYLQHYRPGAQAQFLEEDVFRAIIPVPSSADGSTTPNHNAALASAIPEPYAARLATLAVEPRVGQRLAQELKLFLTGSPLSAGEVAVVLKIAIRTVHRDFKLLQNAGLIVSASTGTYQVAELPLPPSGRG